MQESEDMDFATELRVRTRQSHALSSAAWSLTVPVALSSPKVYRLALKSFYFVYLAIEAEMERLRRMFPKVSAIYFPEILRTKAFEEDLLYYYGPSWQTEMGPPSACTVEYVKTMHDAVEKDPLLIIAYCQAMYMGLFAGGQYIRLWCVRAFGLRDNLGTRAFDFSDKLSNYSQFRVRYKDSLNSLILTRQERDRIIEQKKLIFQMNGQLFAELRATRDYRSRILKFCLLIVFVIAVIYLALTFIKLSQ